MGAYFYYNCVYCLLITGTSSWIFYFQQELGFSQPLYHNFTVYDSTLILKLIHLFLVLASDCPYWAKVFLFKYFHIGVLTPCSNFLSVDILAISQCFPLAEGFRQPIFRFLCKMAFIYQETLHIIWSAEVICCVAQEGFNSFISSKCCWSRFRLSILQEPSPFT